MMNQTKENREVRNRSQMLRNRRLRQEKKKRRKTILYIGIWVLQLSVVVAGILWGLSLLVQRRYVDLTSIRMPDWVEEDFIPTNPYSRPGTHMVQGKGIVIHYVANPGTTAKQNMNYFASLKDQTEAHKISASSHFIIGLDGEILQGIPIYEIAYATSKEKNRNTVSIECCHPDETGKFNDKTYASLVKLTAWLCREMKLTEKDVIRHYDATGKDCPRYYVAHEEEWKRLLKDVKAEKKILEK
ncbi:peptidoglycan recognition family protein [Clostridium sp. E02]|uniref:peptidoglycan recognition protein family protein n=1 Tax=Clostridium sp. E02 TaxID=2487134 RepID=UPI000F54B768|nr:peptidoglycan recognition family protein [Clostridium sp. E02]